MQKALISFPLFAAALISLCLPYTIRIGAVDLPDISCGYELYLPHVVIGIMLIVTGSIHFTTSRDGRIWTFCWSMLMMLLTFAIRYEIHEQDFDHHYDTLSGKGFYLLSGSSFAMGLFSFTLLIRKLRC